MKNEITKPTKPGRAAPNDEIARRAYAIWESNGCPDGRDQEYWFQAEAELVKNTEPFTKPVESAPKKQEAAAREPLGIPQRGTFSSPRSTVRNGNRA